MLRDRYQTINDRANDVMNQLRREFELSRELRASWPRELDAEISFDSLAADLIRCRIYVPMVDPTTGNATPEEWRREATRNIRRHLVRQFGRAVRGMRETSGEFFWYVKQDLNDEAGPYERFIVLERAHPESCTVRKVTKQIEVYESICDTEPDDHNTQLIAEIDGDGTAGK